MAYTKTTWQDRVVQNANTYTMQNNPDGTITLLPAEGTITTTGTPINSSALNNLETQYDQAVLYANATFSTLSSFAVSRTTNGYQYLPGGMIFQWGTVALPTTLTANSQQYVDCTFPITFPANCFMVTHDLSGQDASGNTLNLGHRPPTITLAKSQIRVENFSPLALASGQVMFFAIGK